MGFSGAVQWWEEWQLRVLVLASLFLQYFLFVAAPLRKHRIPGWFRFLIWLAYLGSDAVAIYALAALFNRHKKEEWVSAHRESANVEALWAPILLVHLGGQDTITEYNIEDNELWTRHVLTAVSQITVAIYVFHKSWSGDIRLFQAAIIFFVIGIMKCLEKPWALRCASISSLMKSTTRSGRGIASFIFRSGRDIAIETFDERMDKLYKLFVDIAPSEPINLFPNDTKMHDALRKGLSYTFDRLYTKEQVKDHMDVIAEGRRNPKRWCGWYMRMTIFCLAFVPVALFHKSHRKSYDSVDVKVSYALLGCTAALELMTSYLPIFSLYGLWLYGIPWPDRVAQYNLIGYLARNRKHRWLRRLLLLPAFKDYLDHLWCMKPCESSRDITGLVHRHLKGGQEGPTAAAARAFNDSRGHRTLRSKGLYNLERGLQVPFDKSVLLWHLATDFCFYGGDGTGTCEAARRSRVISNYMAYLLFVNPEMLMTGARPSLFKDAYEQLKGVLPKLGADDGEPARDHTAPGKRRKDEEEELAAKIIHNLNGSEQGGGVIHDAWALYRDLLDSYKGDDKYKRDDKKDDDEIWRVIEGVWVEMLCFSAGRCRGYLHAKSLGKGGEYLSYVWLLLSYMGVETLAQKVQRADLEEEGGSNDGGAGCTVRASAATATTIGDSSEMTELHEEGDRDGGAGCSRTTIDDGEIRGCNGGSHRTTSAAPTTPGATTIVGDDNV